MIVFSPPVFAQRKLSERKKADTPKTRVIVKESPKGLLSAKFKSDKYESERILHDLDKDGWCDLWCSLFKNEIAHRNKRIDTDGDGLTDYEEMVLMRNPSVAEKEPRKLTREEIADKKERAKEAKKRATARQAELRKMFEPIMHKDAVDAAGNPVAIEDKKAAKRQRMGAKIPAMKLAGKNKMQAAKAAAGRLGMPERFETLNGGTAVLSGEKNGRPTYTHTRSSTVAADTISVDDLWPGGSSGFDLTGMGLNGTSVKIGVWEPSGLVIDHPEFTTAIETIDSTDATTGWSSTGGGFFNFNNVPAQCQEGSGCLDLRRSGGSASTLYFRQQSNSYDFTDRTVAVWYYFGDVSFLVEDEAVELRFGSDSSNYWSRSFNRNNLQSGWNLLSMKAETATSMIGSPTLTSCSYTALNVTFLNPAFPLNGDGQGMDFWRLSDTRVQNMDRAASVGDHSTHTTAIITATGVNSNARGMAFEANVHSRDSLDHLAEMGDIFSNADSFDDIFTSNHSYGPNPGWTAFPVNVTTAYPVFNAFGQQTGVINVPPGNYSAWFANSNFSTTEDIDFGRYTNELSAAIDDTVYASDAILPVWAAGNDRGDPTAGTHFEFNFNTGQIILSTAVRPADGGASGYDSMPPDSVAKNILTVGSVQDVVGGFSPGSNPQMSSFSSYGPTDDGRIKPDVCANGDGVESAAYDDPADTTDGSYANFSGTSEAAPGVAGSIGLITELIRRFRGDSYEPPASLLKGLLIHTADDILNPGPDYRSGWGLVNAERAAELVNQSESTHQGQSVRTVLIQNGATVTIPVVATGGTPLKVTVCSSDPAGTEAAATVDNTTRMLVNDFQLRVTSGGSTFNPFVLNPANPSANATTGVNDRDNVEQVLLSSPGTGQAYNIVLSPAPGETFVDDQGNPAPQEVAVIISGIEPDPSLELIITSITQTGPDKFTLVWPALIGSPYRIQESADLSAGSFTDITGDIVAETAFVAREVTADPTTIAKKFWRVRKVQ